MPHVNAAVAPSLFGAQHNFPEVHRNKPSSKGYTIAGIGDSAVPNVAQRGKRCKTENVPPVKLDGMRTRSAFEDITNGAAIASKDEERPTIAVCNSRSSSLASSCSELTLHPDGNKTLRSLRNISLRSRPNTRTTSAYINQEDVPVTPSPERKRKWVDIDALNEDDPQACSHYASVIFEHLKEVEHTRRPSASYLTTVQKELNHSMRAILVDWLIEVGEEYKLCADTLFLAVNYIDRFLSLHKVTRSQLQLVGVTCIWIAAKYEEIYPPNIKEFVYITDNTYSKEDLLQMEELILSVLNWELTVPTPKVFLRRLLQASFPDEQLHYLSNYLTELSLLDVSLIPFLSSEVAAAAVYLANALLKRQPWTDSLEHYSGYAARDIFKCVEVLAGIHAAIYNSPALPALREKYGSKNYQSVSSIPPLCNIAVFHGQC